MPAKKTRVDKKKLYKLVKEGKSAAEIMEELKIGLKQSLKSHLFDLSVEKNEVLVIPGMTGKAAGNRKVNTIGLQIPLSQLKGIFEVGTEFEMSIEKDKIVLKRI